MPNPKATRNSTSVPASLWLWLFLARFLIWLERGWREILVVLFAALTLVGLALFGLFDGLNPWLHLLILAVIGAGLAVLGWRLWRIPIPRLTEAVARLEKDSGLTTRPISMLLDRPAAGMGADLFAQAQQDAKRALGPMGLGLPRPVLAALDPWGLAVLPVLVVFAGLLVAGPQTQERLARIVSPDPVHLGLTADQVDLWVRPPAYTGQRPFLAKANHLEIPSGSQIEILVRGGWQWLKMTGPGLAHWLEGEGQARKASGIPTHSGRLSVGFWGLELTGWDVSVLMDQPPQIQFDAPPKLGPRYSLNFAISASDDYGLEGLGVEFGLTEPNLNGELRDQAEIQSRTLTGAWAGLKQVAMTVPLDLTPHPWAGRKVWIRPWARDFAGQISRGEQIITTLPVYKFQDQLAQQAAQIRQTMLQNQLNPPQAVLRLSQLLQNLKRQDRGILAVMLAALARQQASSVQTWAEATDNLWQLAILLEEGRAKSAQEEWQAAQNALEDAIRQRDADALNAAMRRLQQSFQNLMQQMAQGQNAPLSPDGKMQSVSADSLMAEMQAISDLIEAGAFDAARDRLQRLAEIMANATALGPEQLAQIQALRQLSEKQARMAEETEKLAQNQSGDVTQSLRQSQEAQQALTDEVKSLFDEMGKSFGALGRQVPQIQSEMGQASQLLGGDGGPMGSKIKEAARHQRQAADMLQEMADGLTPSSQGAGAMPGFDPFGRLSPQDGFGPGDKLHWPEGQELQKSRQILDEIRRRAGEQTRPEAEKNYLRRLEERF